MRNIYSPDVRTAGELVIDQLAARMGLDPYQFRRKHLSNERVLAVLDKVAEVGQWGKPMTPGTAQGIAIHEEYKGATACLVEIDCRPRTRKRKVRDAVTGPRVTRVTFAVDAGLPINPRGLEAQMQGGINDGIAQALTSSLHLQDGHFLEASWDNYVYTRQWNTAAEGPGDRHAADHGGPGRCRRGRASPRRWPPWPAPTPGRPGTVPTYFPINHRDPLLLQAQAVRAAHPAVAGQRPQEDLLRGGRHAQADLHPQRQAGHRERPRRRPRALGAARPARGHRPEVRLRHQRVQGVHLAHQRQGVQPLLGAGRRPRRRPTGSRPSRGSSTSTRTVTTAARQPTGCTRCSRPGSSYDVAQCGYCQPGQIMAAVALVRKARREGRKIKDKDSTRSATSAAAAPTPASARRSSRAPGKMK